MKSLNGLNTDHISANLGNYEASRTGFFMLLINQDQLGNLVDMHYTGDPTDSNDTPYYNAARTQEIIKLAVSKCDIPSYEIETLEYRRGNDVVKFAGKPTFSGSSSLTIDDYVGLDTRSILLSWQRLAYDPYTRKGGRMADYKKDATLVEYTQDYEEVRSWKLEGCWISSVTADSFDRENDGKRTISATLVYDRAVMVLPNEQ